LAVQAFLVVAFDLGPLVSLLIHLQVVLLVGHVLISSLRGAFVQLLAAKAVLLCCMAGGERERKGKKKESRFNDLKRPKPAKAELKALSDRREGFGVLSESCASFKLCPFDGEKLAGRLAKCPKCKEVWGVKVYVEAGPSKNAVLVNGRLYLVFWRRKIFWRMTPPFHSWVV
jgi:hypothetical protein